MVLNMRMSRRLAGPGCDERILETAAMRLQSPSQRQLSTVRLRGTRRQRGAPPPGEQGGPHGRFGGEEADDDEQHVVDEAADEVQARQMRFWLEPPPLVGCLAVHLNRRRRRCTRVLVCVVCWVCASASFCACRRAVVNCARVRPPHGRSVSSMRPQFTSVRGATPSGFNFVYFTACQMGL